MTYVGCNQARDLLEGLVDGELAMADQLAVESHLRWCRDCTLRVQDMRLIGSALRLGGVGTPARREDEAAVAAMNEAVVLRVRAERDQAFTVRLREMFTDMRFMWPALGATVAVAVCVSVVAGVLQASIAESPESLRAIFPHLAEPGTEENPLRPANNGISIPRLFADDAKRAGGTLDQIPQDDVIYAVRTVVNRDGRISNFEVLLSDGQGIDSRSPNPGVARAVMDAVQQSRFAPAHTPLGEAVAVDMVWVIAKTTAVLAPPPPFTAPRVAKPRVKDVVKPAVAEPAAVVADPVDDRRSEAAAQLTTA
jgi:hypothetical protein